MAAELATISADTSVVANEGVAATPLGDRLALLNLSESTYYTMNPVAAAIWASLDTPRTPTALAALVREQFEVGAAEVDADIAKLLSDLLRLKLIRVTDA